MALKPAGPTIFTPEQEGYLGDVVAEMMQRELRVYRKPELTERIGQIVARLAAHLPAHDFQFRVFLIELPQANAFALPGGRIYVSRRLVAFVQNEDELAGILAHEMGHVLARQGALAMTKAMKRILNVTAVGDRDDIARKFHQLLDVANRTPGSLGREDDDQLEADRISLQVAWMAGYDPQAMPRALDRLTENKGAKGNFITDFFGVTRPESKRLREFIKGIEALPANCRQTARPNDEAAFRSWQKTVTALDRSDLTIKESGLEPVIELQPKLPPKLTNIRFSPDGRMLLAQSDSSIDVLRREPLEHVFRIPALEAHDAFFDKDSSKVLFQAAGARVEIWDVRKQARERMWEPEESKHCEELKPSPDGRTAACMNWDEVKLLDIETNQELGQYTFNFNLVAVLLALLQTEGVPRPFVRGEFSPDGSVFLAGSSKTLACCPFWAFDTKNRREISIGKPLRGKLGGGFAFTASDRIVAANPFDLKKSGLYSWPDGKLLAQFPLPDTWMDASTGGAVLLFRPFGDYAAAAFDLEAKQIFQVSAYAAIDHYADVGAAERSNGEVALYPGHKSQAAGILKLPEADLGGLRSAVHSPDLEWLALSVENRSRIWNLKTGKSALFAPFDGGSMSAEGVWTTTFEVKEKNEKDQGSKKVFYRAIQKLSTLKDPVTTKLPDKQEDKTVRFAGRYEVSMENGPRSKGKSALEVKDTFSNKVVWSREIDGEPRWSVGDQLVLEFGAKEKTAERLIKESPALQSRLKAIRKIDDASLLEVVDLATGKPLGRILIERSGVWMGMRRVHLAGRTIFVEDTKNRALAYSLDTGERSGQQFGRVLAVEPNRGLAAVQNESGQIDVVDPSMRRLANFAFPGNVIYAGFDGPGKRLLAVTGAQEVFIEDLP